MWHTNGGKGCRQGLATSGATGTDFDRSVSYPYLNQQGQVMSVTLLLAPSPRFTDFFIKKAFVHPWRLKAFFVLFNFFLPPPKAVWSSVLQWWFGKARTLSFLLHTRQFFACGRTQGQISREASLKLQVGLLFHTGANVFLKPLLKYSGRLPRHCTSWAKWWSEATDEKKPPEFHATHDPIVTDEKVC